VQQDLQEDPQQEPLQVPLQVPQQTSTAPASTLQAAHDSETPSGTMIDPDERPINPARSIFAAGERSSLGRTECERCGGFYKSGVGIATHRRSCKGTPQYS